MNFKKATLSLSMLIILFFTGTAYSVEHVDIGYRKGLVIETAINLGSYYYVVGERSQDDYSYGLGLGYKGNFYSGLISVSQTVGEIKQYKTELQLNYTDGHFSCFVAAGLQSERTDLVYKLGAGYPIGGKTSITAYISDKGFFFGIRKEF